MRAWDESETPAASAEPGGETRPVPLFPTPAPHPMGFPSPVPEVRPGVPPVPAAAEPPPEDLEVLIARLDRMAKELFKNKPPPGSEEDATTEENSPQS